MNKLPFVGELDGDLLALAEGDGAGLVAPLEGAHLDDAGFGHRGRAGRFAAALAAGGEEQKRRQDGKSGGPEGPPR